MTDREQRLEHALRPAGRGWPGSGGGRMSTYKLSGPFRLSERQDQPCGCYFVPSQRIIFPICTEGKRVFHDSADHGFVKDLVRFQVVLDHFNVTREQV